MIEIKSKKNIKKKLFIETKTIFSLYYKEKNTIILLISFIFAYLHPNKLHMPVLSSLKL